MLHASRLVMAAGLLLMPQAAGVAIPKSAKLLVVGASGGTGSRALRGLLDVGYEPAQLRVLTRDPLKTPFARDHDEVHCTVPKWETDC